MSEKLAAARARRTEVELADVLRRFGPSYERRHGLSRQQRKAVRAITRCRTAALGGHVDGCDQCGHVEISYNSCRNRHCPKCQGTARAKWVAARLEDVLPIGYYHVVFTLPHEVNALGHYNQRAVLNLLFRAASETLMAFGRSRLGGELGVTAALHTWGQTLIEHLHLHCIVTGGALSADGQRWVACRNGYLFPVTALSAVFRAKYIEGLERHYRRGQLRGAEALEMLRDEGAWRRYLERLWRKAFVVYAKRPFAGPEEVVGYVGRYTHRVAITNSRIVGMSETQVGFEYRDYREGGRRKVMWLAGDEFVGRFLRHVLPKGFQRIRHYGLMGPKKGERLARCRALLGPREGEAQEGEARQVEEWGREADCGRVCAACGVGRMVRLEEIERATGPPSEGVWAA